MNKKISAFVLTTLLINDFCAPVAMGANRARSLGSKKITRTKKGGSVEVSSGVGGKSTIISPCSDVKGSGTSINGAACEYTKCNPGYTLSGKTCLLNSTNNQQNPTSTEPSTSLAGQGCPVSFGTGVYNANNVCEIKSCNDGYIENGGYCVKNTTGSVAGQTCTVLHGSGVYDANNACQVSACDDGYVQSSNSCVVNNTGSLEGQACTVLNGTGKYDANNACQITSCNVGYKQEGNSCVITNTGSVEGQACDVLNGTGKYDANNACQITLCNDGYKQEGNACVVNSNGSVEGQPCDIVNGTGKYNASNVCKVATCNDGFMTDAERTSCVEVKADTTKPVCTYEHGKGYENAISPGGCLLTECDEGYILTTSAAGPYCALVKTETETPVDELKEAKEKYNSAYEDVQKQCLSGGNDILSSVKNLVTAAGWTNAGAALASGTATAAGWFGDANKNKKASVAENKVSVEKNIDYEKYMNEADKAEYLKDKEVLAAKKEQFDSMQQVNSQEAAQVKQKLQEDITNYSQAIYNFESRAAKVAAAAEGQKKEWDARYGEMSRTQGEAQAQAAAEHKEKTEQIGQTEQTAKDLFNNYEEFKSFAKDPDSHIKELSDDDLNQLFSLREYWNFETSLIEYANMPEDFKGIYDNLDKKVETAPLNSIFKTWIDRNSNKAKAMVEMESTSSEKATSSSTEKKGDKFKTWMKESGTATEWTRTAGSAVGAAAGWTGMGINIKAGVDLKNFEPSRCLNAIKTLKTTYGELKAIIEEKELDFDKEAGVDLSSARYDSIIKGCGNYESEVVKPVNDIKVALGWSIGTSAAVAVASSVGTGFSIASQVKKKKGKDQKKADLVANISNSVGTGLSGISVAINVAQDGNLKKSIDGTKKCESAIRDSVEKAKSPLETTSGNLLTDAKESVKEASEQVNPAADALTK